jgi:hypothetical protein
MCGSPSSARARIVIKPLAYLVARAPVAACDQMRTDWIRIRLMMTYLLQQTRTCDRKLHTPTFHPLPLFGIVRRWPSSGRSMHCDSPHFLSYLFRLGVKSVVIVWGRKLLCGRWIRRLIRPDASEYSECNTALNIKNRRSARLSSTLGKGVASIAP